MSSRLESIRIKAKLLQKAKKKSGKEIQLKVAYNILAKAAGYPSWTEYKESIENTSENLDYSKGSTLNSWFKTEEEANAYKCKNGGTVLKMEKDYVVVSDK